MSLIPTVSLSEFKKLKADQIRQLKSFEMTSDGEYLCTVVIPNTEYIKTQTEYTSLLSNSVGGKAMEELLEAEVVPV